MRERIRPMHENDVAAAVQLYRDANKFTTADVIERWTRANREKFPDLHLVYERDGAVIGAISGTLHRGRVAVIEDIAVQRAVRGKGIGAKLLRRLLALFAKERVRVVRLWAHWTCAAAIPFYCRNGFSLVAVRRTRGVADVPDSETVIVLEKQLRS